MNVNLWWHGLILAIGLTGGWCISEMSEPQDPSPTQDVAFDDTESTLSPLTTLDWLVGSWEAETPNGKAEFSCKFSKNDAFLVRSFRVFKADAGDDDTGMSGVQIVAWDPAKQAMRSWTFDSNGGFGEDVWSQSADSYTLRTAYTLPDGGKASSLNAMTYIDEDTFAWRSSHREIDGEMQPDSDEVLFRRVTESDTSTQN
jgi:hypothetical protein